MIGLIGWPKLKVCDLDEVQGSAYGVCAKLNF